MRKMTTLLAAVVFMAALTVVQRLFLDQSDTGKEWALMAAWCWLYNWYLGAPNTRQDAARQSETTTFAASVTDTRGGEQYPGARTPIGLAASLSGLDDSRISGVAADNELSRPPQNRPAATIAMKSQ